MTTTEMSGMDRLSVLDLEYMRAWHEGDNLVARAVSELLAYRRASQAAPAVEICQFCHDAGASACACFEAAEMGHAQAAPAPSDGLREAGQLVQRLRAHEEPVTNRDGNTSYHTPDICQDAADFITALRERAEAAEAESKAADFRLVDRYRNPKTGIFSFPDDVAAIVRALDAARRAEAAAWNDAIEAAADANGYEHLADRAAIRALRRAAPKEGEA